MVFGDIFGKERNVVIGMVHCLPLPGTARYAGNPRAIVEQAVRDALTLEKAGVDGLIVENMGDDPFAVELDVEQSTALAAVAALVKKEIRVPLGIDAALNDYRVSLSIAEAVGGAFVRIPVFVDTVEFYGGIVTPCAHEAVGFRKRLGAERVGIFADIHVKHTHMVLTHVSIEDSAKAAQDCGADAIIVTGTHVGAETPMEIIERAKKVASVPLIVASGVKEANIKQQMAVADGAIIGSSLKEGGVLSNPVSFELTKRLLDAMRHGGPQ
jgi:membrane complex biogenesis BtpA family protein